MEKIYERINFICVGCNKPFSIPPAEQKYYEEHNLTLPKRCKECRSKRKETVVMKCVDCNKEFTMTKTNIDFFNRNGLELPKRCPQCIADKKAMQKEWEELKNKQAQDSVDDFF